MSAILKFTEAQFEPMLPESLAQVLELEHSAYAHPWSRGNFSDALRSGYRAQLLTADQALLGYFVAMRGVDEVHLLNITVAPQWQRQGWGRTMLDAVARWAGSVGARWLWLEVRISNQRAIDVYESHGYRRVGERKGYYPAADGQREDAIVMSLPLWVPGTTGLRPAE